MHHASTHGLVSIAEHDVGREMNQARPDVGTGIVRRSPTPRRSWPSPLAVGQMDDGIGSELRNSRRDRIDVADVEVGARRSRQLVIITDLPEQMPSEVAVTCR